MTNKEQLIREVQAEFKKQFKTEPTLLTLTPGRINIIGEHTDYNEGLAMPAAIDRWICGAVCESSDKSFTIYSLNYKEKIVITPKRAEKINTVWKKLAAAAIDRITVEFNIDTGINMVLGGNIPIGCGLSSSSGLVISITQTFCHLFSIQMEDRQLARLCQKIENRTLGTAGGLLDQYGIILSKKDQFMVIDFQDDSIAYIPAILNDCTWVVVNSQVPRELSESAYLQRVDECNEGLKILKKEFSISSFREIDQSMLELLKEKFNVLYKRLCHVTNENQRVLNMKDQLQKGAAEKVGTILNESHKSLSHLYEVSCEEIYYMIEMSEGVDGWHGGRIMGGGFGGCCIHLVADGAVGYFTYHITESYRKKFNIIPKIMNVTFPGDLKKNKIY